MTIMFALTTSIRVVVEPLAGAVRQEKAIKGVRIRKYVGS